MASVAVEQAVVSETGIKGVIAEILDGMGIKLPSAVVPSGCCSVCGKVVPEARVRALVAGCIEEICQFGSGRVERYRDEDQFAAEVRKAQVGHLRCIECQRSWEESTGQADASRRDPRHLVFGKSSLD
jgi:hypothetical protein